MSPGWTRRKLLASVAGLPLAARGAFASPAAPRELCVTLCGQLLIKHPLCREAYDGLDDVITELRRGDITCSGLEVPIRTPQSGSPTREGMFLHVATPDVLPCVKQLGFDLLALSNNHAWDLGSQGVLATRRIVREHGFVVAGTGANLSEASAPAFLDGPVRVALVAMAIGSIAEGGAATADRPGVNEVRFNFGQPVEEDVERVLSAVRSATQQAALVIVYLSNHEWGEDRALTKPWARRLVHRLVDAGAGLFFSHGAPLLHGVEMYREAALFHSLGSLVFHSRTPPGHYPPEVWESVIAHVTMEANAVRNVELVPVALNELGDDPSRQELTRGRPRIATGRQAHEILSRVAERSAALGTRVSVSDGRGWISR